MKFLAKALLLTAVGLMTALPAQADRDGYSIQDRMEHQQSIIRHGIESGALTHHDAMSLRREQDDIRALADDLRRSGTPRDERHRIIDAKLDRAEHHIRERMHNDRSRNDYERHDRYDREGYPDR